jgi:hypothetical protein
MGAPPPFWRGAGSVESRFRGNGGQAVGGLGAFGGVELAPAAGRDGAGDDLAGVG